MSSFPYAQEHNEGDNIARFALPIPAFAVADLSFEVRATISDSFQALTLDTRMLAAPKKHVSINGQSTGPSKCALTS